MSFKSCIVIVCAGAIYTNSAITHDAWTRLLLRLSPQQAAYLLERCNLTTGDNPYAQQNPFVALQKADKKDRKNRKKMKRFSGQKASRKNPLTRGYQDSGKCQ